MPCGFEQTENLDVVFDDRAAIHKNSIFCCSSLDE